LLEVIDDACWSPDLDGVVDAVESAADRDVDVLSPHLLWSAALPHRSHGPGFVPLAVLAHRNGEWSRTADLQSRPVDFAFARKLLKSATGAAMACSPDSGWCLCTSVMFFVASCAFRVRKANMNWRFATCGVGYGVSGSRVSGRHALTGRSASARRRPP
jgi:hypothetical protein